MIKKAIRKSINILFGLSLLGVFSSFLIASNKVSKANASTYQTSASTYYDEITATSGKQLAV